MQWKGKKMRGMSCKWGVKKVEEVAVYICVVAMEGMKCVDVRRDRERKATHNDTKENKPNTKKRENKTKTKTKSNTRKGERLQSEPILQNVVKRKRKAEE